MMVTQAPVHMYAPCWVNGPADTAIQILAGMLPCPTQQQLVQGQPGMSATLRACQDTHPVAVMSAKLVVRFTEVRALPRRVAIPVRGSSTHLRRALVTLGQSATTYVTTDMQLSVHTHVRHLADGRAAGAKLTSAQGAHR